MRNSATSSFDSPEFNIKDFDVLWLDDHLSQLVTPVHPSLLRQRPAMEMWLGQVLVDFVDERGGEVAIQDVRKHLSEVALGDSTALSFAEHEAGSLRNLLYTHPDVMLKEIAQVFLIRRHTPFSPYVVPRFPHMSEMNSLFAFFFSQGQLGVVRRPGARRREAEGGGGERGVAEGGEKPSAGLGEAIRVAESLLDVDP